MANSEAKSFKVASLIITFKAKSLCCPGKTDDCSITVTIEPIQGLLHGLHFTKPVCDHMLTQKGKIRKVRHNMQRLSRDKKSRETDLYCSPEAIDALTRLLMGLKARQMNIPEKQRTVAFVTYDLVASSQKAR